MLLISCTFIGVSLFILGSTGNGLCILVFLRQKFRHRLITPYFIVLLLADSVYLIFRLMKLPYYSQTIFRQHANSTESCSNPYLAGLYQHATQTWPQPFVPFVQSDTYMRFSLILMSIMSVQRTAFISRSLRLLVLPSTYKDVCKYKWTISAILTAFLIAYTFEFAGLTLFCSKSSDPNLTYDWFFHMSKYMENASNAFINTIANNSHELKCVDSAIHSIQRNQTFLIEHNSECSKTKLTEIISYYFDQHQKTIVNLIQKIIFSKTGQRITRNEIRRQYHFHECLFPLEPSFFHRYYNFMYTRTLNFNRHTIILVLGSIVPSLITIASNMLSVWRVRELNRLTSMYILPCRRRTDDTRRVLLVITVECLFAIINSWFSDIVLALVFCKRNLSASDDCPTYLKQNIDLLIMFDMMNSISNIVLHSLCGKRFRNELQRMLKSYVDVLQLFVRDLWCCYLQIDCKNLHKEPYVHYKATVTQGDSSNSSNSANHNHIYLKIQTSKRPNSRHCFHCRWYFNRRPTGTSKALLSVASNDRVINNQTPYVHQPQSLTQRTCTTKQTQTRSMRLYYPSQKSVTQSTNKSLQVNFR